MSDATKNFLRPYEIARSYSITGAAKTKRAPLEIFILGILAGMFIALAGLASSVTTFKVEDVGIAKLVSGLIFPFGLIMVVIMGAELFTGNCLICISLLDKRCTAMGMAKNWIVSYLGNFVGSILVVLLCTACKIWMLDTGELGVCMISTAIKKCSMPFGQAFTLGILCNILVTLAVLMSSSGTDNLSRMAGAFIPVCLFVVCGFEHSVANMFYIPAGILASAIPACANVAIDAGLNLSKLTISSFFLRNLLPVTLGNIFGGALVSWTVWLCNLRRKA